MSYVMAWWPHVHNERVKVIPVIKFIKTEKGFYKNKSGVQRCYIVGQNGEKVYNKGEKDRFIIKYKNIKYKANTISIGPEFSNTLDFDIEGKSVLLGNNIIAFRKGRNNNFVLDRQNQEPISVICKDYVIETNISDEKKNIYFIRLRLDIDKGNFVCFGYAKSRYCTINDNKSKFKFEFIIKNSIHFCGLAQYKLLIQKKSNITEEMQDTLLRVIYHHAKSFYHIHECRESDAHIKLYSPQASIINLDAAKLFYIKQLETRLLEIAHTISNNHKLVINKLERGKRLNKKLLFLIKKTRQICNDAIVENNYAEALLFETKNTKIIIQNIKQSISYIKHINTVLGDILGERQYIRSINLGYNSIWMGVISLALGLVLMNNHSINIIGITITCANIIGYILMALGLLFISLFGYVRERIIDNIRRRVIRK